MHLQSLFRQELTLDECGAEVAYLEDYLLFDLTPFIPVKIPEPGHVGIKALVDSGGKYDAGLKTAIGIAFKGCFGVAEFITAGVAVSVKGIVQFDHNID